MRDGEWQEERMARQLGPVHEGPPMTSRALKGCNSKTCLRERLLAALQEEETGDSRSVRRQHGGPVMGEVPGGRRSLECGRDEFVRGRKPSFRGRKGSLSEHHTVLQRNHPCSRVAEQV